MADVSVVHVCRRHSRQDCPECYRQEIQTLRDLIREMSIESVDKARKLISISKEYRQHPIFLHPSEAKRLAAEIIANEMVEGRDYFVIKPIPEAKEKIVG